ncbi:hypothetical protein L195_g051474, partial [Trifolium pratense]
MLGSIKCEKKFHIGWKIVEVTQCPMCRSNSVRFETPIEEGDVLWNNEHTTRNLVGVVHEVDMIPSLQVTTLCCGGKFSRRFLLQLEREGSDKYCV